MALQRTSGVLEIDGNPAGAIYLDRGQITFARASWVPDLMTRLSGALQPPGEWQNLLRGGDQPDRDIGRMLLRDRVISSARLQAILRSAVLNAVLVLTVPLADESFVSDIRFQVPGAHWAGAYSRVRVEPIRAEAVSTAQRMARYRLTHTAPVTLRDLDRASVLLKPRQWAVACTINSTASAPGSGLGVWPGAVRDG